MGGHDDGGVPDRREDARLGLRVEVGRRLVQQHQRRVAEEHPGERDPLPLPRGQPGAVVAEPGRQPVRQCVDEPQRAGLLGGAAQRVVGGAGRAEADVGAGAQPGPLTATCRRHTSAFTAEAHPTATVTVLLRRRRSRAARPGPWTSRSRGGQHELPARSTR